MSSTNKTANYELSQYVGTDKPTYLSDYNSDMSKIDTGIHEAQTKANQIGDLSTLVTENKNNLVMAINEVDTHTDTNSTDINTNKNSIGTLTNLNTIDKSNLVNAINENYDNLSKFNLTEFDTYAGTQMTCENAIIQSYSSVVVATNEDGSIGKIYGAVYLQGATSGEYTITIPNTKLRPSEAINILSSMLTLYDNDLVGEYISIDTNGTITLHCYADANRNSRHTLIPCLYFMKNFGDVA